MHPLTHPMSLFPHLGAGGQPHDCHTSLSIVSKQHTRRIASQRMELSEKELKAALKVARQHGTVNLTAGVTFYGLISLIGHGEAQQVREQMGGQAQIYWRGDALRAQASGRQRRLGQSTSVHSRGNASTSLHPHRIPKCMEASSPRACGRMYTNH